MSSFFETLLHEAVGPCFLSIENAPDLVIDVPTAADLLDLHDSLGLAEQLDILAGTETADDILDLFEDRPHSDLADVVDDIREHFALLVEPGIGWAELIGEIDKYGVAIERDLMDIPNAPCLYDWVRDHRNLPWNKLVRLLSAMPEAGHYLAAIGADTERAERILALQEAGEIPKSTGRPSLLGWSAEHELYTEMVETLRDIQHAVWGASPKFKGKGGRPPRRMPRPRTGMAKAKEIRSFRDHDEIGMQVLGSRYKPIMT